MERHAFPETDVDTFEPADEPPTASNLVSRPRKCSTPGAIVRPETRTVRVLYTLCALPPIARPACGRTAPGIATVILKTAANDTLNIPSVYRRLLHANRARRISMHRAKCAMTRDCPGLRRRVVDVVSSGERLRGARATARFFKARTRLCARAHRL